MNLRLNKPIAQDWMTNCAAELIRSGLSSTDLSYELTRQSITEVIALYFYSHVEGQSYQERVAAEKEELDEKLAKLKDFCFGDNAVFDALDPYERDRLERQYDAMKAYSDILAEYRSMGNEGGEVRDERD